VGFLKVYDKAFGEIAQGGTRRGANMAVLRVDHPDIEHFITCKTDETAITNFNISVGITDAFMEAVINDDPWELRFPDVKNREYRAFNGTLSAPGICLTRSFLKPITTESLVCSSSITPTETTPSLIYMILKQPILAANNIWDHMRTAVWVLSTSASIS
jgi:hypothetical protein